MRVPHLLLAAVLTLPLATPLVAQVSLAELPDLARARAERARPAAIAALEPFLPDLKLSYRSSYKFMDGVIEKVAELGDSVVPLLLEMLEPKQNSEAARNLAGNARRVLEKMDPSSFVDALAELLKSRYETTRREAIRLLGLARTPQAARLLVDLLQNTAGENRVLVLQSLARHGTKAGASYAVQLLGNKDSDLRANVLDYLAAARAGSVSDLVADALSVERDDRLLMRYIHYFGRAVRQNDRAARALLGLLGERVDWQDTRQIVRALAKVAPTEHEPTVRRLLELIEDEKDNSLAVETAVTLRALGERAGVTKVKRNLDDQLRRPARRRETALYQQRANLLFAIGDFSEAADDYEKIIEYSGGVSMTRMAYIGLMRCEAHRGRHRDLVKVIRDSGFTVAEIEALAIDDEVMREALEHDRVKRALDKIREERAPKLPKK